MKKFCLSIMFVIFFGLNVYAQTELNGDYSLVDSNIKECDFIGNAKLNINYNSIKIKANKWKWKDSSPLTKKIFKGKFKKNYTNITIIAKDMGSKHKLEGTIEDNKIFLTFSSTHEEANLRYGGCTFILAKD